MSYIGTSTDKTETAFWGLKENLERLAQEAPSEEEIMRAKQALLGGQAIDSQQLSYQCSQLAYSDSYGLGFDNFLKFRERIEAVDAEKVRNVMRAKLEKNPPIIAVVGPTGTWVPKPEQISWKV